MDWLVSALGFKKQAAYLAPDNVTVMHAQLTLGSGMIMLDSADNASEYGKLMAQPDEIGLRVTQGVYLVVPDADAACTP